MSTCPHLTPETHAIEVVTARGEIDLATAPQLAHAVDTALGAEPKGLVIDLSAVSFIDSRGLAVLVDTWRRARAGQIALRIVCDVPSTLRVFELTGLDQQLDVVANLDAALQA